MSKWSSLLASLLAAFLGAACEGPAEPAPPNIVLIVGDDYGYPYYGFT